MVNPKKKILGIETSCDETAAGVVDQNGRLLANVVASQSELHARFGEWVPEVASRQHLLSIQGVLRRALDEAGCGWEDIDAVAVTNGPGLAGALIVGVNVAKGLAASLRAPLVGVITSQATSTRLGSTAGRRSRGRQSAPDSRRRAGRAAHVHDRVRRAHGVGADGRGGALPG